MTSPMSNDPVFPYCRVVHFKPSCKPISLAVREAASRQLHEVASFLALKCGIQPAKKEAFKKGHEVGQNYIAYHIYHSII